jgi:glycosyltransferase involved in cell wall biosynthesis
MIRSLVRPLRILRLQSRICIGGPSLNTKHLSLGLQGHGYETLMVGGRLDDGEQTMIPELEASGVSVVTIDAMGRSISPFEDLRAFWALLLLIRRFRPQIVHTHTAKAGALGRLAAWLCRVPVRIHTFHGHVFEGYFSPWKNRLILFIERFLAWTSHGIVAISEQQYQDLTERFSVVSPKKCRLIRLGIEEGPFFQATPGAWRQRLGVSNDTRLLGIVARLVPIKRHELLLRAVAHYKKHVREAGDPPFTLLIVGDGALRGALTELHQTLNLQKEVQFCGWQKDMPSLYADLDLNLLVSKNEGTPVSLIEGLMAGVPFLSTRVGGIVDFAPEGAGWLVDAEGSIVEVAKTLGTALRSDRLRQRLEMPVRQRIAAQFGVARLVDEMDRFYRDLLPVPFGDGE